MIWLKDALALTGEKGEKRIGHLGVSDKETKRQKENQ